MKRINYNDEKSLSFDKSKLDLRDGNKEVVVSLCTESNKKKTKVRISNSDHTFEDYRFKKLFHITNKERNLQSV